MACTEQLLLLPPKIRAIWFVCDTLAQWGGTCQSECRHATGTVDAHLVSCGSVLSHAAVVCAEATSQFARPAEWGGRDMQRVG